MNRQTLLHYHFRNLQYLYRFINLDSKSMLEINLHQKLICILILMCFGNYFSLKMILFVYYLKHIGFHLAIKMNLNLHLNAVLLIEMLLFSMNSLNPIILMVF